VDVVAVGVQGPGAESSTGYEAANPNTGSIADLGAGFDTILSVGALAVCRDLAIFVERIKKCLAPNRHLLFFEPDIMSASCLCPKRNLPISTPTSC